jgi:hypothetical protein
MPKNDYERGLADGYERGFKAAAQQAQPIPISYYYTLPVCPHPQVPGIPYASPNNGPFYITYGDTLPANNHGDTLPSNLSYGNCGILCP